MRIQIQIQGVSKKTEFYQIEHLEIQFPVWKIHMIFVTNLEMLNSIKAIFFANSVEDEDG